MTDHLPSIWCSGFFPFIPCYDASLTESFRFCNEDPLLKLDSNCRVVRVPMANSSHQVIAVSGYDESPVYVRVFDVSQRSVISRCVGHDEAIFGLTSIPASGLFSSSRVVSGCSNGKCFVFDALTGSRLSGYETESHEGIYCLLALPGDESQVLAASDDLLFRFDLNQPEMTIAKYRGHNGMIHGVASCASEKLVFTTGADCTLRIWSRDYNCIHAVVLPNPGMSCLYEEQSHSVLIGSDSGGIDVRDLRKTDQIVKAIRVGESWILEMSQMDESRFVAGTREGSLALWDLATMKILQESKLPSTVAGIAVFRASDRSSERKIAEERLSFIHSLDNCGEFDLVLAIGERNVCLWTWLREII